MRPNLKSFIVVTLAALIIVSSLFAQVKKRPQMWYNPLNSKVNQQVKQPTKPQAPPTQTTTPTPAQPPAQQDATKKKEPQRQGSEADNAQDGFVLKGLDTDEVLLDVAVFDQAGKPIEYLKSNDFMIFEDKVKQEITSVARVDVPLSLGIVIDTSGSMRTKLQTVSDSALGLIKQMKSDDEAFLSQFKAEAELVRDFTRDKRELEDGLNDLYTGGGTALLDAIIATADYAQEKGKQRKKALVVITDGVEKNSAVKEKEVSKVIQEDDVQVYLIGILDETDEPSGLFGRSGAKKAKDLLIKLAEDSGGRAFFPKDAREIPEVMAQIAKDLRSQYVVSYQPSNDKKDGTYRKILVDVTQKENRKFIVRTRQGYTAKANPAQAAGETKIRTAK
jgi:Ca-activated chloride channel homolog